MWRTPRFMCISSVAQSCPTLCDPMDCSTPDLPAHHQLLELAQTHVHGIGDAIQPSHPLSSPSPPAFNLSQHQGLCQNSVLWIRGPKYWHSSYVMIHMLFMCISSMEQMLNESTSRKRTEELGSSWGSSRTARRSVCPGPEGWAGFQGVKREKGMSGELPAPGREAEIPKARVHVLMPAVFLKPQDHSGSLRWITCCLDGPESWRSAQVEALLA